MFRILLTNDDGINAPGIVALHQEVRRLGEVFTVAPLTVQSATSHGVTFSEPLMIREMQINETMHGVAVDGRPADCVKLAITELWPERMGLGDERGRLTPGLEADDASPIQPTDAARGEGRGVGKDAGHRPRESFGSAAARHAGVGDPKDTAHPATQRRETPGRGGRAEQRPDLVVSGINAGLNVGIHIVYSGTVAAALEAAFLGVPAIAVSLHIRNWKAIRWDVAARWAREAIERLMECGPLDPHTVLNVNLPACESDEPMPEMVAVPMNLGGMLDSYDRRRSPLGQTYFWATGDGLDFSSLAEGSDVEAIFQRYVTLTPLRYDLTDHERLAVWRNRVGRLPDAGRGVDFEAMRKGADRLS